MRSYEIALIGSFRQHYEEVLYAWKIFSDAGWHISSPKGSPIRVRDLPFVRFTTDSVEVDDPGIQTLALHRILRSDVVYTVVPNGYIGRTTCYEVGRVIQAGHPIYFSERPQDLPLALPGESIVSPQELVDRLRAESPRWPFDVDDLPVAESERRLRKGLYEHA